MKQSRGSLYEIVHQIIFNMMGLLKVPRFKKIWPIVVSPPGVCHPMSPSPQSDTTELPSILPWIAIKQKKKRMANFNFIFHFFCVVWFSVPRPASPFIYIYFDSIKMLA